MDFPVEARRNLGGCWIGSGNVQEMMTCIGRSLFPNLCPWHRVCLQGQCMFESWLLNRCYRLAFLFMLWASALLSCASFICSVILEMTCFQSDHAFLAVKERPYDWVAVETLTAGRNQVENSVWRTKLCCIWSEEEMCCQGLSVSITVCDQKIWSSDFCISPKSALWHLHLVTGSFKAEPQGPAFL